MRLLTLQTYSSCVRTSTHRQREEPSTCSSRRYFSATNAAWKWCCWGAGLGGAGGEWGEAGEAVSLSASPGEGARSSALLCSPASAPEGLLSRSGHNNDGDPGSITDTNTTLSRNTNNPQHTQTLKRRGTTMRWTWSATKTIAEHYKKLKKPNETTAI